MCTSHKVGKGQYGIACKYTEICVILQKRRVQIALCRQSKQTYMKITISDTLNSILNFARDEAMRTGSYQISPDHLYLGILRHSDNIAAMHLRFMGVELSDFKEYIDSEISTGKHIPYSEIDNITLSRNSSNIVNLAVLEVAKALGNTVGPQHLLLALLGTKACFGTQYLIRQGIDHDMLLDEFTKIGVLGGDYVPGGETIGQETENSSATKDEDEPEESRSKEEIAREGLNLLRRIITQGKAAAASEAPVSEEQSLLEEFGYDLTAAAREHRLDPVVGREEEIQRVLQILGRRKKNNAMLIGDPGVGKSAIVEGIAIKIATGDIPESLRGKRLVSLDIASVVAGTKYRGDFEKRLKGIMSEISANPDVILFIDEFHTMVGAGAGSGSLDAANMLKPALARGEIQCIGATTLDEFRKIVEKDGALDRRFQKVIVRPTTPAQTLSILERMCPRYEQYHGVIYGNDALEACVGMSERYITDRCLPDKALDIMDEAGSRQRLRGERAVRREDVAEVVSKMTGIPVSSVARSERERLRKMASQIERRIVGQDEAVSGVVRAIRRNRAGIKDPARPVGTFLFVGPTGVGKTQLAKTIAEYLFDSEENIVRIDMSEYSEKFNVSRLIGAPPGYVGYEEGGQLSEKVRRKPYCVVLLDEIEKAHPDVYNLLLQVLDDGRLTDSDGFTVDFRNTILIMTSNVGTRELSEYGKGVGFMTAGKNVSENRRNVLDKALKRTFPPEFINRIDEVVYFESLSEESIGKIVDIELKALQERILETGYRISIAPAVKKFIAKAGFDPAYGARPLRRVIQRYIEDPVSEYIIEKAPAPSKAATAKTPTTLHLKMNSENTIEIK